MARWPNTTAKSLQRKQSSRVEAMPVHMPGNVHARVPDHAHPTLPQRGRTGGRPRAEPGAAPCPRRPLTKRANPEGSAQTNQNTASPAERTGSHPKRTNQKAEGQRGRWKTGTPNLETLTPREATTEAARRPRTLLTAGGAAGRRTNSEYIMSSHIYVCVEQILLNLDSRIIDQKS